MRHWQPGEVIVLREVIDGRIRSARPLRVIADSDVQTVAYLVPDSVVAWPRLANGDQSQTPDQGWILSLEEWFGPGSLYILSKNEPFAAILHFDRTTLEPVGWKVDLMEPVRRFDSGFDTLDHSLDLMVDPSLTRITTKDEDDLDQLERVGILDEEGAESVRDGSARARELIEARVGPFGQGWERWRPERDWPRLRLPTEWETIDEEAAPRRDRRSAAGTRVIDGAGRVLSDFDLADDTLVFGHTHPAIVDALRRQLPLGTSLGPDHGSERALRRLFDGPVTFASSGVEALRSAVLAAETKTGRSEVALVGPATDISLDPHDVMATARRLSEIGGDLASIVVDPHAWGGRAPTPEVLELLAAFCADTPTMLIADERHSAHGGLHGTLARLGVHADAVVHGESLAAGQSFGAVVGGLQLASEPPSTLALVAALETARMLTPSVVERLDDIGARLRDLVSSRVQVLGFGPFFRLVDVHDDVDVDADAFSDRLAERGVLLRPDGTGSVCTETTQADLEALADALRPSPAAPTATAPATP